MAAAEYYFGTQGALQNRPQPPNPLVPQQHPYSLQQPPQSAQQLQNYNHPPPPSPLPPQGYNGLPPAYSPYAPSPQLQSQGYSQQPPQQPLQQPQFPPPPNWRPTSARPTSAPYPQTPPNGTPKYPSYPQPQHQPQVQQNGYLGAPLQKYRSHSQPPRVHFEDGKSSKESDLSDYSSDSDDSRRRRHGHRRHSNSSRRDRSRSSSLDRDRDYDSDRSRHRDRKSKGAHKNRDTLLGASAGGLVGDMIFPGLGTVGGLLLGGYGGRKHADKRSRSHAGDMGRDSRGRKSGDGWDEETATYRKGHAVR